ncbi:hypothetical protein CDAR_487831 [Caerostris darwini]|uniref:Uncharacterized protein n=1 Tax=Caerostris darwini TaxID=1538125 RepID=A0AAV4RNL3_9ARAC|nr:hypothetical protein CDAR_487831 [Caerostris darwini]
MRPREKGVREQNCSDPVMNIKLQNICDGIDEVIGNAQKKDAEPTVMATNLQKIRDEVKEFFAHTDGGKDEPCSEDDIPEQDDQEGNEN